LSGFIVTNCAGNTSFIWLNPAPCALGFLLPCALRPCSFV
jgi:hypothetical protein